MVRIDWIVLKRVFFKGTGKMATSDEEITRLYRIQRTLMQMLNDRGYIVADHELNMTKQRFISKYGEHLKRDTLSIQKAKRNDSSDQAHHGLLIDCVNIIIFLRRLKMKGTMFF